MLMFLLDLNHRMRAQPTFPHLVDDAVGIPQFAKPVEEAVFPFPPVTRAVFVGGLAIALSESEGHQKKNWNGNRNK